uniref:CCHC-type domain-containing protein n=1 Tax=Anoplophora glabripennis TaxID=217634 RepID=V5G8T2_ANOGL
MWARERNTKKEVKDLAGRLQRLMREILMAKDDQPPERTEDKQGTATSDVPATKRMVSVSVQTDAGLGEDDEDPGTVKYEDIQKVNSFGEFMGLERKNWKEKIFKNTTIIGGSLLKANREEDIAYLLEKGGEKENENKGNEGIRKAIEERYPDLQDIEGDVSVLAVSTKVEDKEGFVKVRERHIYKVATTGEGEDWFHRLSQVRDKMVSHKRGRLSLYPPISDGNGARTRKMLECLLQGTNIKGTIYVKGMPRDKHGGTPPGNVVKRNRDTEAILVERGGNSYADLLRRVKDSVSVSSVAARGIKTIREGRNGQMVIVIDKSDREGREELQKQLADAKINANRRGRTKVFVIKDVDGDTSKEEVLNAVLKDTGLEPEDCTGGELRPYFGGNRAMTLRVEASKAKKLIEIGKIRIGLNQCPVTERIQVIQCFNCWRFGHTKVECKESGEKSNLCRNCAGEGHKGEECDRRPKCLSCNEAGHRTGSGRCTEFRKALNKARLSSKRKKAS